MSAHRPAEEKVCQVEGCGEVVLVVKGVDGKTLVVGAEPTQRYALSKNGEVGHLVDTYEIHFKTCPGAGWWRAIQDQEAG